MADEYIDKVEVGAKIQMMYIRREMDYGGENDFCRGMRKALRVIENMPVADVQPVVYAHKTTNVGRRSYCSNCGKLAFMEDFCSKCGAKVKDGEQND